MKMPSSFRRTSARLRALVPLLAVALAAGTVAAPARAGVKPPQVKLEFEKYTLPNGLEVILREDHRLPIVAVNTWYHVGPANEAAGRTGFAHLFEHMMFQASAHVGEDQFWKHLEGAGASFINGTTDFDRTNYMQDVPSNQLELALWLESDRMGFLLDRVDAYSLANQQDVVRNERRQGIESQPYNIVEEEMWHMIFPKGHPYYAWVIGSHEDIQAAKLDDVKDFFRRYYAPNNASLAIVGDIDKAQVKKLVEKYYGSIPRGEAVPAAQASLPPITSERRATITDKITLPRVYMAWLSAPAYKPGDAEATVAANILGGGKASRLYKSLVYEKQIAQDVSVQQQSYALTSVFQITATVKPGKTVEEVEKAIDEELATFVQTGPTEEEVAATQTAIYSSAVTSLEHLGGFSGVADRLNHYNQYVKDPGYFNKDLARFAAVTPAAVKKFAAESLGRDARVVVHAVPGEKKLPPDPAAPAKPEKTEQAAVESKEPWRNTPPGPGPAPKAQLPTPKRFALPNGLSVYLVDSKHLPLVSANLVFRSGSAADPADLPGLAGFTTSMMDEGTKSRNALQIANEIHALGASLSTGTQTDGSNASVRSLKQNAPAAFSILSDVVLNPSFPEKEIERIRNDRRTALLQQRDQPWPTAVRVMNASLFGPTHPYGHHQLGTEESIQKTTKADLERFYGSAFGPKNAALILVGDLTEAEARKLATDAFGAWRGDAVAAPVPPQGTTLASRVVIVDKPSNQTTLLAGQMGVRRSDPDYEKLDVMNSVLGGLFSSRINLNLREDKGYSYGAFSFVGQNRGVGPLMAGAAVRADVTGASIQEILNEVTKIKESGVTAEELTMAKESITRSLPANFETTSSTAGTIAQIYMYDLPVDYYQTLPSRLAAIQPADVLAVAKKHLVPERMVIVAVGDRSVIEPQITKLNLGAIAYRDADGKEMAAAPAAPATPN